MNIYYTEMTTFINLLLLIYFYVPKGISLTWSMGPNSPCIPPTMPAQIQDSPEWWSLSYMEIEMIRMQTAYQLMYLIRSTQIDSELHDPGYLSLPRAFLISCGPAHSLWKLKLEKEFVLQFHTKNWKHYRFELLNWNSNFKAFSNKFSGRKSNNMNPRMKGTGITPDFWALHS